MPGYSFPTRKPRGWCETRGFFLVPKPIAKPGVQAMISSQSRVQYREGYDPSDNYADEVHFSPDLDPMEPSF